MREPRRAVLIAIALLGLQQPKFVAVTGGDVAEMAAIGDRDRIRGEWKAPEDTPPNFWEDGQLALRDFREHRVVPERLARTDPMKAVTEMIGSGPYRFLPGDFVSGSLVAYAKFDGYVPRKETPDWATGAKVAYFPPGSKNHSIICFWFGCWTIARPATNPSRQKLRRSGRSNGRQSCFS